jgi:hypothetical protein
MWKQGQILKHITYLPVRYRYVATALRIEQHGIFDCDAAQIRCQETRQTIQQASFARAGSAKNYGDSRRRSESQVEYESSSSIAIRRLSPICTQALANSGFQCTWLKCC